MQVDMDDIVHIRFEGQMVKLIRQLDPEYYSPFVAEENGKLVLYVLMRKALYGTLQAAKLF
jgi:acyl CoA:acetate/3-ketoacid CoA transferase